MRVGGAVGLSAAANIFVGMVEAPLFVRPYLARVSRGELFAIMVGGMASIAGTVLFLYAAILRPVLPDAVAHLLIASILSAPAALVIAFLMWSPEGAVTGGDIELRPRSAAWMPPRAARSRARSSDIIAVLWCSSRSRAHQPVIAPYSFRALSAGRSRRSPGLRHPPEQARVGAPSLGRRPKSTSCRVCQPQRSRISRAPARFTYALCGFANFGSLGIMIGGLGTMCPERRSEVVALGLKSIVAGTLATCLTAATVGLLI